MRLLLPTVILALSLPAAAQTVYRWLDAQGEEHFTDDRGSIPLEYRKAARAMPGMEPRGTRPATSSPPPASEGSRGSADSQESQRREAAREKLWREAFRTAREKVESIERSLAADRAVVADPNAAGMPLHRLPSGAILPSPEYEALKKRVERSEGELARAREALEDLDRRASLDAVPQGWRR